MTNFDQLPIALLGRTDLLPPATEVIEHFIHTHSTVTMFLVANKPLLDSIRAEIQHRENTVYAVDKLLEELKNSL